jgi:hypothetical protein
VIRPDDKVANLFVVFNSGTATQERVGAKLVAADRARDLAVLAIEHDKVPAPLTLSSKAPHEIQNVFVLGFPFGESLSSSGKHPSVTISRAGVSSLRRNVTGRLVTVQLDGALNPGNSGGPVVSENGEVVGVSVASILGAQIGLAIPPQDVDDILSGRPLQIDVVVETKSKGSAKVDCEIQFADPLSKINSASLLVIPMNAVKELPQVDKDGSYVKLSNKMREYPLRIKDGKADASFTVKGEKDESNVPYYMQIKTNSVGSVGRYSETPWVAIDVSGSGEAKASVSFGIDRHEDKEQAKDKP